MKCSSASKRLAAQSAGLAVLGAAGQPGADGEDRRQRPEDAPGRVADKRQHFVELGRALEDVDLVDDDHDFLAPRANRGDEGALGFGERAVRRGHEQDEIGPRHELRRQALVLADDRVRARRVDDVEVLEEVDWGANRADARAEDLGRGRGTVADEVNVRGRRRDAFVEHARAEQGVDERALAGVELADDDEEEELVELPHRLGERGGVWTGGGHGRELDLQVGQQAACVRQLAIGLLTQDAVRQHPPRFAVITTAVHCRWVRAAGLGVGASGGRALAAFSGRRREPSTGASRLRLRSHAVRSVRRPCRTRSTTARSPSRRSWSSPDRRLSAARRFRPRGWPTA